MCAQDGPFGNSIMLRFSSKLSPAARPWTIPPPLKQFPRGHLPWLGALSPSVPQSSGEDLLCHSVSHLGDWVGHLERFLLVLGEERRVYYLLLFPAEVGTPRQRKMRFLGGQGRVSRGLALKSGIHPGCH